MQHDPWVIALKHHLVRRASRRFLLTSLVRSTVEQRCDDFTDILASGPILCRENKSNYFTLHTVRTLHGKGIPVVVSRWHEFSKWSSHMLLHRMACHCASHVTKNKWKNFLAAVWIQTRYTVNGDTCRVGSMAFANWLGDLLYCVV